MDTANLGHLLHFFWAIGQGCPGFKILFHRFDRRIKLLGGIYVSIH